MRERSKAHFLILIIVCLWPWHRRILWYRPFRALIAFGGKFIFPDYSWSLSVSSIPMSFAFACECCAHGVHQQSDNMKFIDVVDFYVASACMENVYFDLKYRQTAVLQFINVLTNLVFSLSPQ